MMIVRDAEDIKGNISIGVFLGTCNHHCTRVGRMGWSWITRAVQCVSQMRESVLPEP